MNKIEIIRKHLTKEKKTLNKAIKSAKKARDSAPSAMESHSDTTRNQSERLVFALQEKKKSLEKIISKLPTKSKSSKRNVSLWSYTKIILGKSKLEIVIVPEGIGGKEIGKIKLISKVSPLGKSLLRKKVGDNFKFNNKNVKIVKTK